MVARLRGAKFIKNADGTMEPEQGKSFAIANLALADVAKWLGYSVWRYNTDCERTPAKVRRLLRAAR